MAKVRVWKRTRVLDVQPHRPAFEAQDASGTCVLGLIPNATPSTGAATNDRCGQTTLASRKSQRTLTDRDHTLIPSRPKTLSDPASVHAITADYDLPSGRYRTPLDIASTQRRFCTTSPSQAYIMKNVCSILHTECGCLGTTTKKPLDGARPLLHGCVNEEG